MSSKAITSFIRKYLWDIPIIQKLWHINIIVGILFAIIMPEILPLTLPETIEYDSRKIVSSFIYGLIFAFITEFVKTVYRVPKQIEGELLLHEKKANAVLEEYNKNITANCNMINTELSKQKDEIARTYYKGFYALLTNFSNEFEKLEGQIKGVTGIVSPLRSILFDFIVGSLANIGRNGFAMVDASISDYVEYISKIVEKSQKVIMTCVVRPYYLVVDEIQGVSLPPYLADPAKYGKGEHLSCFSKGNGIYQRWLIVDELMMSEMFLTAYIDKYFVEKVTRNNCPVCSCSNNIIKCSFHEDRIIEKEIKDIPEIWWFEKCVNLDRGVDLKYTLIREAQRKMYEELEDRVVVESPMPGLDIRFAFTTLEKGILRITWENKVRPLVYINDRMLNKKIMPDTGLENTYKGHKFYAKFKNLLREDLEFKTTMINHLSSLSNLIEKYFNTKNNISSICGQEGDKTKKMLAEGNENFKKHVLKATKELIDIINKKKLEEIYFSLLPKDIPKVAYFVVNDTLNPYYPIRAVRWKTNWDGDGESSKGILNV